MCSKLAEGVLRNSRKESGIYSVVNHGKIANAINSPPIPGRIIPKTQKMVLDASLLNTQHYKVRIKSKVEPSREGVSAPHTSV